MIRKCPLIDPPIRDARDTRRVFVNKAGVAGSSFLHNRRVDAQPLDGPDRNTCPRRDSVTSKTNHLVSGRCGSLFPSHSHVFLQVLLSSIACSIDRRVASRRVARHQQLLIRGSLVELRDQKPGPGTGRRMRPSATHFERPPRVVFGSRDCDWRSLLESQLFTALTVGRRSGHSRCCCCCCPVAQWRK